MTASIFLTTSVLSFALSTYPEPDPSVPDDRGPTPMSRVMKVVLDHKAALNECAEEMHRKFPENRGTLVMAWNIQADGTTSDVKSMAPELDGMPIVPCVSGVIRRMKFPRHSGAPQHIRMPFKF